MATSVLMGGNSSDHHLEKISTIRSNREMEMSGLIMNGSGDDHEKHTITRITSTGKPAGRRKKSSKLQGELGQKKKIPQRGVGVEKLERMRVGLNTERVVKKMTQHHHHENYNINPSPYISLISQQPQFPPAGAFGGALMGSSLSNGGSGSVGHGGQHHQTPAARLQQFQGFKYSGINDGGFHGTHLHVINNSSGGGTVGPLFSDETFLSHHDHPFAAVGVASRIRAGNGNSTEASRELSSIPNNMKWYSEHCGFCQKKFLCNGETIMCNINGERKMPCGSEIMSPVINGFGSFAHVGNKGNIFNGGNLNYFASQTTTPPPQEAEVKAVHSAGKGNSSSSTAGGGDGGSSHVVMEYEFFPGKFGGSTTTSTICSGFIKQEEEVVMSLKTDAAASSSVHHHEQQATMVIGEPSSSPPAAEAAISSAICSDHQNSNSIDLSLKLSCYYS